MANSNELKSVCQCCLTEEGILKTMCMENYLPLGNLLEIYESYSGIPQTNEDEYKLMLRFGPQKICENCIDRLVMAYKFQKQCKDSYSVLILRYTLLCKPKEEQISDDEPLILNHLESGTTTQVFLRETESKPTANDENTIGFEEDEQYLKYVDEKVAQILPSPQPSSNDETTAAADEDVDAMEAHFMCYYCDAILSNFKDYAIHRENHVMEHTTIAKARSISRTCSLCGEFQVSYVKHLESEHRDFHPNRCKQCKKVFRSPKLLKKHLYKHLSSDTFECHGCHKKFRTHSQRRSHLALEKHSKDVYRCSVCGLGCKKFIVLHKHFQKEHKHQNTKQLYPCYNCRSVFSYIKYLTQHKCFGDRKQTPVDTLPLGVPLFTCDRCNSRFLDEDEMVCHKFTTCTARSKCTVPECGKVLENRHALLNHMRRHEQKGNFICDECGFSACSAPKLAIHKEKHKPVTRSNYIKCSHPGCTAELKNEYTLQSHLRRHGEGQFECYLCNKRFRHRVTIQSHMIKFHIPAEQLQHVCEECGKRFYTTRELRIHKRLHNDDRPMRCQFCPKAYRDPANLKEHVRRAHEGIHYRCMYCAKKYSERMKMKEHLFLHRGFKPFSCPECSSQFTKRFLFIKHLLSHNIKYDEDVHGYQEKEDINEMLKACRQVPVLDNQYMDERLTEVTAEPLNEVVTTVFYTL